MQALKRTKFQAQSALNHQRSRTGGKTKTLNLNLKALKLDMGSQPRSLGQLGPLAYCDGVGRRGARAF